MSEDERRNESAEGSTGDAEPASESLEASSDASSEGAAAEAMDVKKESRASAKDASSVSKSSGNAGRTALLVAVALLVGGGAGWFARQAHAKTLSSEEGCRAWEQEICSGAGEQALACYEARSAAKFLPAAACEMALDGVPDTLAKIAASRAPCTSVTDKLCAEFGPNTPTCTMVREKTHMFPAERCEEMLKSYDLVVRELRMMQQGGGVPMAQPGAGSHDGHGHGDHGHDGHGH